MAFRQNRFAHSSFVVGKKSSSSAGYGFPLGIKIAGSTSTRASAIYADDAGVALIAGSYVGFESRTLLTAAIVANTSVHGIQGHLRNVSSQDNTAGWGGNIAGVWAYNETSGTGTVGGSINQIFGGLNAAIDVPSGCTIASGKYVCAIGVGLCDLGGTHTGKATVLQVVNPSAGHFDYFAVLNDTGSCTTVDPSMSNNTRWLPVICPGGVAGAIRVYTA
jgi:hypothetical protein